MTIAATAPAQYQINMAVLGGAFERLRQVGDEVVGVFDAAG
jgi:hypothetical protein